MHRSLNFKFGIVQSNLRLPHPCASWHILPSCGFSRPRLRQDMKPTPYKVEDYNEASLNKTVFPVDCARVAASAMRSEPMASSMVMGGWRSSRRLSTKF